MAAKETDIRVVQTRKMEELHGDTQRLKSSLQFMTDELLFLDRLLNSDVFEPNTPNLFERLQDYKARLVKAKRLKTEVHKLITIHENGLNGILECKDATGDLTYYREHEKVKSSVVSCNADFQNLKTEIFNYAGGILKKRKS